MTKRHLLPLLFSLCVASAQADVVRLTSGETLEGTIVDETEDSVTIEVPFSETIVDTRIIAKSDIAAMDRVEPDEVTWKTLASAEIPATALDTTPYEELRRSLETFVREHPESPRIEDAKEMIESLRADELRFGRGEVRFNGEWLSATRYAEEKYQIGASMLANEMRRLADAGDSGGALNKFEELKKKYPQSIALGEAISTARRAVGDLERRLDFELANLPIKLEARARTLERASITDKPRIERAMEEEEARFKQIADRAKTDGNRFFMISSIDKSGLEQMRKSVDDVKRDIARPDLTALEARAERAKRTIEQVASGTADEARAAYDALAAEWAQFEGLPRLKARVEEKEAAAAAAAATPEPTPTPEATPESTPPAESEAPTPAAAEEPTPDSGLGL